MNRNQVESLLLSNDRAVERAMVVLYQCQTVSEQHSGSTQELNGRGFNAFHAKRGSYYAKWVLSGKHLTGHHLAAARRMACHYARQLATLTSLVAPAPTSAPNFYVYPTREDDVVTFSFSEDYLISHVIPFVDRFQSADHLPLGEVLSHIAA